MATRLYPNTKNIANLETLAGVPHGTAARLAEVEARHEAEKAALQRYAAGQEQQDLGYEQWKEINDDADLGALHHLQVFGWGRFDHLPGLTDGYAGALDNLAHVRILFQSNGLPSDEATVALTEGVHWS